MESKLLAIFDRLAHPKTGDIDCQQSIAGLRRMLHGKLPSDVLAAPTTPPHSHHRAEIARLKQKLADVEGAKATSERERACQISTLQKIIDQLQRRADSELGDLQPSPDGSYTAVQIACIIHMKFGKDHGVKKALVEKNFQQRRDNSEMPKITDSLLQQWRRNDRYPGWMVDQLKALTPADLLPKRPWTMEERTFLHELHNANPCLSNQELADRCSKQFGRYITDSSIRGALHRARSARIIAPYRPKEHRG